MLVQEPIQFRNQFCAIDGAGFRAGFPQNALLVMKEIQWVSSENIIATSLGIGMATVKKNTAWKVEDTLDVMCRIASVGDFSYERVGLRSASHRL